MATTTKTLEATLVRPTAHKEQKLINLLNTYRDALIAAFEADCRSMSAVNALITPVDLPYQAKDALKQFVPRLRQIYHTKQLGENHPIRFVNRAAVFDHDSSRTHEFCWQVPQSGRGTNFWIPLRINPDQRNHWYELVNGKIDAGKLQLELTNSSWRLLVPVTFPVQVKFRHCVSESVIGLDVGESMLVVGCALSAGSPLRPLLIDGRRTKHLRKELSTTLKRLRERESCRWRIAEQIDYFQNTLTDIIEKASRKVINYAQEFQNPVLAMEDLTYIRENLDYGSFMNRRLHSWGFSRIQSRIEDKAREAGITICYVPPRYTSKTCHACGVIGYRPFQAIFKCKNSECHITEFQADINAAANIATRVNPWGESVPWKPDLQ